MLLITHIINGIWIVLWLNTESTMLHVASTLLPRNKFRRFAFRYHVLFYLISHLFFRILLFTIRAIVIFNSNVTVSLRSHRSIFLYSFKTDYYVFFNVFTIPQKYYIDGRLCRTVRQVDLNKSPRHCIYLFVILGYYYSIVSYKIVRLTDRFLDGRLERRTRYPRANSV